MLRKNNIKTIARKLLTAIKYYRFIRSYGVIISSSTINSSNVFFEKNTEIRKSVIKSNTVILEDSIIVNSVLNSYNRIGKNCKIGDSKIGMFSYIADNGSVNNVTIGNFCSIGPNFSCGYGNHPTDRISTSPYFYSLNTLDNPFIASPAVFDEYQAITIGHDVWIGANVFIKDGVQIGHGAIIAAGSVVIKDIPPYAIAGGVPAKIIKFRHSENIIATLLDSQWWNRSINWIKENIKLFQEKIEHEIDFN